MGRKMNNFVTSATWYMLGMWNDEYEITKVFEENITEGSINSHKSVIKCSYQK